MATYKAPVQDMRFVLHELLHAEAAFAEMPGYEEASADIIDAVLEEAGKICETVLFPLNSSGDEEGCHFENGQVRTPTGFREAYAAYRDGGWPSLAGDQEYGGQGLPGTLDFFVQEMLCSSNVAFSLYPGLTHGACNAIHSSASEELKARYLPPLVEGTWGGSMCLTEAHSGTDLGLLRTRATPNDDGSYAITGTKIFITAGEHDLTENIVHLVLARMDGAPPGVKGISMFLVPKFLVNEDGSLGARNSAHCGSIEHKMGIKASATCVMNFEGATGYLLGEPNRGMRAMFVMMNHERVAVGVQGLGLAETAYQSAVAYARERVQGRAPGAPADPDRPADPIIVHPDVRRMLMHTRAFTEGARALMGWVALQVDRSERHPDDHVREATTDLVALLTPVVKAFFTDAGSEACNTCLQVFGGHGYIREWGMEQLVRDARIAQIYEGTNGVQALDLVGRKLPAGGGRLFNRYAGEVEAIIDLLEAEDETRELAAALGRALGRLKEVTEWLAEAGTRDPAEVGAASVDYLRMLALVCLGHMWGSMARVAVQRGGDASPAFYAAKVDTARYYMRRVLPETEALAARIRSGAGTLMALDAEDF